MQFVESKYQIFTVKDFKKLLSSKLPFSTWLKYAPEIAKVKSRLQDYLK